MAIRTQYSSNFILAIEKYNFHTIEAVTVT